MTLAVIKTGGKQYVVKPGDKIEIEKIPGAEGSEVLFDQVLLLANDAGAVSVGRPVVSNAKVSGKILFQGLGQKIAVIKFKRKIRYKRHVGHRQPQTTVMIEQVYGAR